MRSAPRERHQGPDVSEIGRLQRGDIGAAGFGDGDEIGAAQVMRVWARLVRQADLAITDTLGRKTIPPAHPDARAVAVA